MSRSLVSCLSMDRAMTAPAGIAWQSWSAGGWCGEEPARARARSGSHAVSSCGAASCESFSASVRAAGEILGYVCSRPARRPRKGERESGAMAPRRSPSCRLDADTRRASVGLGAPAATGAAGRADTTARPSRSHRRVDRVVRGHCRRSRQAACRTSCRESSRPCRGRPSNRRCPRRRRRQSCRSGIRDLRRLPGCCRRARGASCARCRLRRDVLRSRTTRERASRTG